MKETSKVGSKSPRQPNRFHRPFMLSIHCAHAASKALRLNNKIVINQALANPNTPNNAPN